MTSSRLFAGLACGQELLAIGEYENFYSRFIYGKLFAAIK